MMDNLAAGGARSEGLWLGGKHAKKRVKAALLMALGQFGMVDNRYREILVEEKHFTE